MEGAGAREDPLHLPTFRKLAEAVPYSKHVHSKLVCAITREPMNEHNHPMVTPAGAIYSEQGISEVTARNGGVFVCPHTGMATHYAHQDLALIKWNKFYFLLACAQTVRVTVGNELCCCVG